MDIDHLETFSFLMSNNPDLGTPDYFILESSCTLEKAGFL